MHTIQRLLALLWSALASALRFWARDIARRRVIAGKAIFGCLGLLVIRCACSAPTTGPSSAGTSVGRLPTRTPISVLATPPPTTAPATLAPAQSTVASAPVPAPPAGTPAPPASAYPAQPAGLPSAAIARVIDGDTVDVNLNGQTARVRLIGIDTPETVDPRRPVECFGREASARAHELLDGQTIFLEGDPSSTCPIAILLVR